MNRRLILALAALVALLLLAPAAQAAGPRWDVRASADTSVAPGAQLTYWVFATNVGDAPSSGTATLTATLPAGLTLVSATPSEPGWDCSTAVPGASTVSCTDPGPIAAHPIGPHELPTLKIAVAADPDPEVSGGLRSARFALSGGGGATAETIAPTRVTEAPLSFGLAGFDQQVEGPGGAAFTQAGRHPEQITTEIALNRGEDPHYGDLWPREPLKDVLTDLPPGLLGNLAALPQCNAAQLAHSLSYSSEPLCPTASQIGVVTVDNTYSPEDFDRRTGPFSVFNLAPPPDAPAAFGFNVNGTVVVLDARLRSGGDYGVSVDSRGVPEALATIGTELTIWDVPADPSHEPQRSCPGQVEPPQEGAPACSAEGAPEIPILRNPTSCSPAPGSGVSDGLVTAIHADSWFHPAAFAPDGSPDLSDPNWKSAQTVSHEAPGFPADPEDPSTPWGARVLPTECESVPFEPTISVQPTTGRADSPSGLEVGLEIPQTCWEANEVAATCQSDLRRAEVVLPEGMSVNPSSASGLGACSPAQIDLSSAAPAACPEAAKIGTVEIETPLLREHDEATGEPTGPRPLKGAVYLAEQGNNPFGSPLAMYLVAEGSGVVIKQAGEISLDPHSGRLTTVFDNSPQQPFEDLRLSLFGGPRAALRTPPCGSYATQATLTGWSGKVAEPPASFTITEGCGGGFNPKLEAGTANPLAGTTSPFTLRLTREDTEAALSGLSVTLPPGLSGYLTGIPYCPDSTLAAISGEEGTGRAQEASPSCPAASQVGTVTVGAGAGSEPFFTTSGRAYLAGPYKGAPLSLAVVTPAVAGPFDLGSVVVRNALRIDPETAQITAVSDPLPTILHGIPLDLRDVRVDLTREHFTLNPTSCDEMQIGSTITSTQGASANPSNRFQLANCSALGFKPKLSLSLKGKTNRGAHPKLQATLTMPEGGANIARAAVTLPSTELLENAHIRNVCTRVIYAEGEGGGANCPKSSIYGYAKAWSRLLDQPLQGPVFLRSNPENKSGLPDLVASLDGQIHIDLVGKIDTVNARIRNTFNLVPDAPVSKFMLTMQGNGKGLLANTGGVCAKPVHAMALFDGQNGKTHDIEPVVKASCPKAKHRNHR